MRIEEIRIGNMVKTTGRPVELSWVVSREDMVEMLYKEELGRFGGIYEGVLLDEGWLIRMGFEMQLFGTIRTDAYKRGCLTTHIVSGNTGECQVAIYNKLFPIYVKHVHQLQNLYYALTGEELVIGDAAEKDLGKQ